MNDYGTRHTDLAVKRAEWRLSRVYHQAAKDIEDKMKAWENGHAAREAKYRQQVKDGKITQADFDAWMRGQVFQGQQWQARKDEIENILFNADKAASNIVNKGKLGVFTTNANYIGYELEDHGLIDTGFTLYDENTVARLVKSDPQILPKAREDVKKDKAYSYYNKLMNSAVTQGIIQGETIPQIAKRIAQTTGERSYTSAVRNARTAFTGAQNAGRMEGLHQAQGLGIEVKKRWMATLDDRTRDAHADLDGQIKDVDEPFDSELGPIDYPGDPTADPANVYNCRCTLVYVYPEYPSDMERRDNESGEIVGDMTYREWEESKRKEFTIEEIDGIIHTGTSDAGFSVDLQLFGEKDIKRQSVSELRKGIKSFEDLIELHNYKIANPAEYYADWNDVPEKIQKGRIKHWEKEKRTFKESIQNREEELKRRGEK